MLSGLLSQDDPPEKLLAERFHISTGFHPLFQSNSMILKNSWFALQVREEVVPLLSGLVGVRKNT
jgi:hypothetical protein